MYDKNPLQCCEVISLQLIKINEKKKKRMLYSSIKWSENKWLENKIFIMTLLPLLQNDWVSRIKLKAFMKKLQKYLEKL